MLIDFLLASAHHILVFVLVACLTAEIVLARGPLDLSNLNRLTRFDAIFGGSAAALLLVGLCRLIWGLKGWEFYVSNHAFWTKMVLFLAAGLISIGPTMKFIRWRNAMRAGVEDAVPATELASVRRTLHLEALLLLLIPVAAAAMART